MKKVLAVLLVLGFAGVASAEKLDLQAQKEAYQSKLDVLNRAGLSVEMGLRSALAITTCTAAGVITVTNYTLDTLPGGTGEIVAKLFGEEDYTILDDEEGLLDLLNDGTRGGLGGAVAMLLDLGQNLLGYLKGDKPEWRRTAEVYASSNSTLAEMSLQEAGCLRNLSFIDMIEAEALSRK